MLARPRWPGSAGAEQPVAVEAVAVVGHAQLDLGAERPQRQLDPPRVGVAPRVHDRLLRDPEQVARHLGRKVDALDGEPNLEPVAALPDRQAALDRGREGDLLERVRAEVDDLVAERAHVAAHQVARLVDEPADPGVAALAAGGRQDHVEADQLLHRAVVDRLGHAPAHLALGLHGAARQPAGAQPRGGLRRAQQADDHGRGERGQQEHGLVEGEDVRVEGGVAADAPSRRPAPTAPMAAIITPRRSPWKCAWAAIRKRAARRTPPSESGATHLEQREQREVDRRRRRGGARGRDRGGRGRARPTDQATNTASTAAARPSDGKPTSATATSATTATARRATAKTRIGAADSIGIRRIKPRSASGVRSQTRGRGGAGRVDQPVDRRAVATLHEGLVVLVGHGVGACDHEGQ